MDIPINMAKQNSKQHAEHNEKACEYLCLCSDFPDWVITTSFYSSLHYLRHKIFPTKAQVDKNTYMKVDTFDHYHSILSAKKRIGRHERFKALVEEKCNEPVSIAYAKLLELSFTARYNDYNYGENYVNEAKKRLSVIKAYCTNK